MTIYNEYLYNVIIADYVLTLFALFYLFFINIASRRTLNTNAPRVIWTDTKQCLDYLCLLHMTSWLMISCLLVQHVDILPNYSSCKKINWVYEFCRHIYNALMLLFWQSRNKTMSLAILQQHAILSSGIRLILKLLVLIPLVTLPFVYYQKTNWNANDGNSCSASDPDTIGLIERVLNSTVCFIFVSLFGAHM